VPDVVAPWQVATLPIMAFRVNRGGQAIMANIYGTPSETEPAEILDPAI
jgi:hypothetical protein